MNRLDVVNAYAAFAALSDFHCSTAGAKEIEKRLEKPALRELVDVGRPYSYRNRAERSDVLDQLTPEAFAGYFALVERYLGRSEAERLSDEWSRINSVDGVEIQIENSDDDPFRVNFSVNDPIANEWAEKHGSLDGGTWECCDGPDFIYDSGMWHEKLFEELKAEGYDLNFGQWSDPEPEDHETAAHIAECEDCQDHWDFSKARECMREPLVSYSKQSLKARGIES